MASPAEPRVVARWKDEGYRYELDDAGNVTAVWLDGEEYVAEVQDPAGLGARLAALIQGVEAMKCDGTPTPSLADCLKLWPAHAPNWCPRCAALAGVRT